MKNILIVDDDKKIRAIYSRLLRAESYNVIETSNADDANEAMKKERIDLVLLDIKMPEIDGGILYEIIKSFHGDIKIIVASVYPVFEQKRQIRDADGYYDKSQGVDILLGKLREALKNGEEK